MTQLVSSICALQGRRYILTIVSGALVKNGSPSRNPYRSYKSLAGMGERALTFYALQLKTDDSATGGSENFTVPIPISNADTARICAIPAKAKTR